MCGIFGVICKDQLERPDRWMLRRLADALVRRGPDGEGFHLRPHVGVGMRRLAIIDPNGGWQPLYNEDRSVALVANGEIYNFVELRRDLEGRGHVFRTGSDCETIVHLYEEYGTALVEHLRGMFAFALIDERRSKVILCRDRMGEKPLLIAESPNRIVFASELSALVEAGAVPLELDADALKNYYHWGFIPEPQSPIRGVRKVPAGSIIELDLDQWRFDERVYWKLEDAPPLVGDPIELVREEIALIGRMTCRSDVPLGVGLSSGIDSSAIAALAKRNADQPVHAFTIGYPGRAWQDESGMAKDFARQIGIPCHRLELDVGSIVRDFPEMCLSRDEPFVDIAGSALFSLMRFVHGHGIRVMMSGLGGDELFWGYGWVRDALAFNERKRLLLAGQAGILSYIRIRRPPLSLVGSINWAADGAGIFAGIRAWRRDQAMDPERLVFWDAVRDFQVAEHRLQSVAGDALRASQAAPAQHFTGRRYWADLEVSLTERMCATYLRSNGLGQVDRLSMASSVEARVPLVDYRLAEIVVGLRKSRCDLGLGHKVLLKKALEGILPKEVLTRRKRGFSPPWRDWIRQLFERYSHDLEGGELVARGILAPAAPARFRRGFDRVHRIEPFALESLALEQWLRGLQKLAHKRDGADLSAEPDLGRSSIAKVDRPAR
jgi:asparagine synthase (glutamine-hydrolysing)